MIIINARGARTLADVRPMTYGGTGVYVTTDETTAQLHIGGRIVAERPAAEITSATAAQDWAYDVIEGAEEAAATPVPDMDAVNEACNPESVYAEAAAQVRTRAAEKLAEADQQDRRAAEMAARPTLARENNPRHSKNRAARIQAWADSLRKDAVTLGAWTAEDESRYSRYVSDGLGATDGRYAPIDRCAWKSTLGA